jgi:hypothetical protein
VNVVIGPLGILGEFVALFVALDFAAMRWGVDSRRTERQSEWWERY